VIKEVTLQYLASYTCLGEECDSQVCKTNLTSAGYPKKKKQILRVIEKSSHRPSTGQNKERKITLFLENA
jgi:hypothetical protein